MADNNKKGTLYQSLNQIFNWSGISPDNNLKDENKAKIVIKGNSPDDVIRKGLEIQQKKDLQNKFFKTTERGFQKAMQYEAARLPAYMDFEGMEYYPIIASALDLFMEESTCIGDQGKMLSIYSQDSRIKYHLEELFYNILNVNVNLPFWIRNYCKYGDNFILLYGERGEGITHVQQCVNYEIERLEKVHEGKPRIIFKERMTGDEFNTFEVAHFRLLGSDQYLPYGQSILSKCRRIWRQLCISSDSKIWTPNGYTLIKDIKIDDDVFSYDYENKLIIHTKVKKVMNNGEKEVFKIKTRHRELILTYDHPILTTNDDGKTFTYKNIDEIKLKKDKLVLPEIDVNIINFEKITHIENVGVKEVWDIEVDNNLHNFIAEGIVIHNCLAEDAMLTYRIVRAGEKKVFRIDVGNISDEDVESYIQRISQLFKKMPNVNPNDGQMDYRFNILGNDEDYFLPVRNGLNSTDITTLPGACLSLDTKIDLLDGRSLTLSEIIDEFNEEKELWVYSINPQTGEIVPSPITWAGVTRKNTEVLKITLDNDKTFTCTPDHKFPTRLGETKEAKDLIVGESLWSFNKKFEKIKDSEHKTTYEMVYNHFTNNWKYTHQVVANYMKNISKHEIFNFNEKYINSSKNVIHHKNFQHLFNNPNNLCFMNHIDHINYHRAHNKELFDSYDEKTLIEHKKLRKDGLLNYMNNLNEDEKQKIKENIKNVHKNWFNSLSNEEKNNFRKLSTKAVTSKKSKDNLRKTMQTPEYREKMRLHGIKIRNNKEINEKIKKSQSFEYNEFLIKYIINFIKNNDNSTLTSFINHVNSGENEFKEIFINLNKNKPFFKSFKKFTNKGILKIIRNFNYNNWKDFINKFEYFNHKIVSIEYLSEKIDTGTITVDGNETYNNFHNFALTCGVFTKNSNLNDIADIQYLRDNLFSSLSIPKPFVSMQDAAGGGKNMAQLDMRFAKKINRIQQAAIQELNKIAMIHLYYLGYGKDEITNFSLLLNNPSTQQEMMKVELLEAKARAFVALTDSQNTLQPMSRTTAIRLIFGFSDKEIIDDLKKMRMERAVAQELQDSPLIIKKTTIFDDIDKKYGNPEIALSGGTENLGGGSEIRPIGGTNSGNEGGEGNFQTPAELPPVAGESKSEDKPILSEMDYDRVINALVNDRIENPNPIKSENKKLLGEAVDTAKKMNFEAKTMIVEIDDLIKNAGKISRVRNDDFQDIENIELIENLETELNNVESDNKTKKTKKKKL